MFAPYHDVLIVDCLECGGSRPADTPPCAEGHGAECPDRACAECGTAIVIDPVLVRESRVAAGRAA